MLGLLLVILVNLNIALSMSWNNSGLVRSRQYYSNKLEWYDKGNNAKSRTTITYWISDEFDVEEKAYIKNEMTKLTWSTCLKIKEFPNGILQENDEQCGENLACVRFSRLPLSTDPCQSDQLTREILLSKNCFDSKWVLHEILHVLGFGDEHRRMDRDCYVEVYGLGLNDSQYRKDPNIDMTFPYDVHSIMHYRRSDRLKPAKFALVQDDDFGQFDDLTNMDRIALNYMFCGGKHYCEIDPERCQYFRCWIECNPCSTEPISQCKNCEGNTYK